MNNKPVSRDYLPQRIAVQLTPLRFAVAELHDMRPVDNLKQYPDGFAPVYKLVTGSLKEEDALAYLL